MGKQKFSDYGMSKNSKNAGSYFSMGRNPKNNGYKTNNYNNDNQRTGRQQNTNRGVTNYSNEEVTAPYNFVPLNTKVFKSPLSDVIAQAKTVTEKQNAFENYIRKDGKYSGYFWLDVETLTPLYIESNGEAFSDGKNLCIPGSSMRGAIKNLFKIVTNSSLRCEYKAHDADVADKRFYFRSFASKYPPFQDLYRKKIEQNQIKAGFLIRKGDKYFMFKANYQPDTILKERNQGKGSSSSIIWNNGYATVRTGKLFKNKKDQFNKNVSYNNYYNIYVVDDAIWNVALEIDEKVIDDYKNDNSKNRLNLLDEDKPNIGLTGKIVNREQKYEYLRNKVGFNNKRYADYDYIVPCFYIADTIKAEQPKELITGFGATPYFRIPYKNTISDLIPKAINQNDIIDYTDAVFGSKEYWGSRVLFEDLYITSSMKEDSLLDSQQMKILEAPKPTSFQNYLNPVAGKAATWETSGSQIRGYKMYWHHETQNRDKDWVVEPYNRDTAERSYPHKISPVKAGRHFKGKIRFENLTEIELGALIFVFGLTNDNRPSKTENEKYEQYLTLKLGMGKPIGLGSVAITSSLYLAPKAYFSALFDSNKFKVPELQAENTVKNICGAFTKAIVFDLPRINELKLILDASYREKMPSKVGYLNPTRKPGKDWINERRILPTITGVITEVKNSLT